MKKYASVALMLAALFWGASGVLTQIALVDLSPMALIAYRFIIAGLIALVIFRLKVKQLNRELIKTAFIMSLLLSIIYVSSTYGLKYTSASNAGFIIGSSVVLVPIINALLFKHRYKKVEVISTLLCFLGLALVTLRGSTGLNIGDFYCFIDAIAYSLYIIYGSRLSQEIDIKILSTLQYLMVALMTFMYISIVEVPVVNMSMMGITAILVLGFVCTFLAFYLQLNSQVHLGAGRSSRILALIPIFTVMFDYIYFETVLTLPALIGGCLVVFSTLFIDSRPKKYKKPVSIS